MLDVKLNIVTISFNSTRIVSFLYKTEGMPRYSINIYLILDLYFSHRIAQCLVNWQSHHQPVNPSHVTLNGLAHCVTHHSPVEQ